MIVLFIIQLMYHTNTSLSCKEFTEKTNTYYDDYTIYNSHVM